MIGASPGEHYVSVGAGGNTWRMAARLTLALLGAALLYRFSLFAADAVAAVRFPFELDYGEGIVWQQALMIFRGDAYGDITQFPYIVFHYPPVYHLLTGALAAAGGLDELMAGRLTSVVATLLTGGIAGALTYRALRSEIGTAPSTLCAVVAGLATFTYWPVLAWAPLMRVDMAAVAFSFLGVYFGTRSLARPSMVHLASLCFVLAIYTKQTMLAAPVATYAVLLVVRPRLALAAMASAVAMGLAGLAALSWMTEGGFLRHILLYNINRFDWGWFWMVTKAARIPLIFLAITTFVAIQSFWRLLKGCSGRSFINTLRARIVAREQNLILAIVSVYLLLATLMLVLAGKSGSNVNYFIEWMCVWSVLIGMSVRPAAVLAADLGSVDKPSASPQSSNLLALCVPLALATQALMLPLPPFAKLAAHPRRSEAMRELVERTRAARSPVVSDDMVLLLRSGKQVPWESAIFAELASTGLWDERPFIRMIKQRRFAFFITVGARGHRLFDSRYTTAVADAIDAAYPRKEHVAGYQVHLPPR